MQKPANARVLVRMSHNLHGGGARRLRERSKNTGDRALISGKPMKTSNIVSGMDSKKRYENVQEAADSLKKRFLEMIVDYSDLVAVMKN